MNIEAKPQECQGPISNRAQSETVSNRSTPAPCRTSGQPEEPRSRRIDDRR